MKQALPFKIFYLISFILLTILFQTCSDNSVGPTANFMSGTITFTDAGFNYNGGYYAVSFYGDSANPFTKAPVSSDSLGITVNGNSGSSYYHITNLASGDYFIGCTWIRKSDGAVFVLGTYGCDTIGSSCTPTKVTFPNYAGTGDLNFHSYTSIYKALYHHP